MSFWICEWCGGVWMLVNNFHVSTCICGDRARLLGVFWGRYLEAVHEAFGTRYCATCGKAMYHITTYVGFGLDKTESWQCSDHG